MGDCCSKDSRDVSGDRIAVVSPSGPLFVMNASPSTSFVKDAKPGGEQPGRAGFRSDSPTPPYHRPTNPLLVQTTLTSVEQVDLVKSRLKATRDRINNLRSRYESELQALHSLLEMEKSKGLPDKARAKYLLREEKLYRTNLNNLFTRQSIISKALSDVNQQHLDAKVIGVMEEANKHMKDVQQELERRNWREVVMEAVNNKPQPLPLEAIEEDPEVDRLYSELERQVIERQLHPAGQPTSLPVLVKAVSTDVAAAVSPKPALQKPISTVEKSRQLLLS